MSGLRALFDPPDGPEEEEDKVFGAMRKTSWRKVSSQTASMAEAKVALSSRTLLQALLLISSS
eukprot:4799519-Karenia_brevis.AAC.1